MLVDLLVGIFMDNQLMGQGVEKQFGNSISCEKYIERKVESEKVRLPDMKVSIDDEGWTVLENGPFITIIKCAENKNGFKIKKPFSELIFE